MSMISIIESKLVLHYCGSISCCVVRIMVILILEVECRFSCFEFFSNRVDDGKKILLKIRKRKAQHVLREKVILR